MCPHGSVVADQTISYADVETMVTRSIGLILHPFWVLLQITSSWPDREPTVWRTWSSWTGRSSAQRPGTRRATACLTSSRPPSLTRKTQSSLTEHADSSTHTKVKGSSLFPFEANVMLSLCLSCHGTVSDSLRWRLKWTDKNRCAKTVGQWQVVNSWKEFLCEHILSQLLFWLVKHLGC